MEDTNVSRNSTSTESISEIPQESILDTHMPYREMPRHQWRRPAYTNGIFQGTRMPMPDMRFEQSYLASIANAKGNWMKIVWITVRGQFIAPFMQGLLYALAVQGLRNWLKGVGTNGYTLGKGLRDWWLKINNVNLF